MKPALLVIDMQKDFFERGPEFRQPLERAIETINAAIKLFRERNLPIIAIEHKNEKDGLVPGKSGFSTHEKVDLVPSDARIAKTYGNAFARTPLAERLHSLDVDTIIITGFMAEYCVLSTCRGAEEHDLAPIILRGSLASNNEEHIRFVEEISEIISLGALELLVSSV
jgi:nicotinamidase-related amidase